MYSGYHGLTTVWSELLYIYRNLRPTYLGDEYTKMAEHMKGGEASTTEVSIPVNMLGVLLLSAIPKLINFTMGRCVS